MKEEVQNQNQSDPLRDGTIHASQQSAAPIDPAAAAFEALREEVALVRRAVAGLAAERAAAAIPDYGETLGNIMQASKVVAGRLKLLGEQPALQLTPEAMARQIAAAAEMTRRADHLALENASSSLQNIARNMEAALRSARIAKRQLVWVVATGGVCFIAGVILWAVIAWRADRTSLADHRSPEAKAAAILRMDQVAAGEHLIQTSAPELWRDLVLGDRIVIANRDVLKLCQGKTEKQRGHCTKKLSTD